MILTRGFITTTNRRYIDITCSNPAAPTYSLRGIRDPHGDPLSIRGLSRVLLLHAADKRARYRPILGDLLNDPQHLAIFLLAAYPIPPWTWSSSSVSKTPQAAPFKDLL